jgi:hypothetical protein
VLRWNRVRPPCIADRRRAILSVRMLEKGRAHEDFRGGIPGVLIAAYIVKSMSPVAVRWLVVAVVLYAAFAMLRSAMQRRPETTIP